MTNITAPVTELFTHITPSCTVCGDVSRVLISRDDFMKWRNGETIQVAFPYLNEDSRELLLTGTHRECWDALFGSDEMEF